MNPELEEMLIGLRESQSATTKLEAGEILAHAGWAVFPMPNNMKNDFTSEELGIRGPALSHLHATTDAGRFSAMAEDVMRRHECRDVNIALKPGACAVPLMVVDLDGGAAIDAFWKEAWERGHADVGLWLSVKTTRADRGGHMYFACPGDRQFGNGIHRWGGEIRCAKGHVVMPPSTTELGRYAWRGESIVQAPEWVVEGLPVSAGGSYRNIKRETIGAWVEELSQAEWTAYGRAAYEGLKDELLMARPGFGRQSRNATMFRVVARILDLSLEYELPAIDALDEVRQVFFSLFGVDELAHRNIGGEFVRSIEAWARNKEDLESRVADVKGLGDWVRARTGADRREVKDITAELAEQIKSERPVFRASVNNWKARIGK